MNDVVTVVRFDRSERHTSCPRKTVWLTRDLER